MLGETIIRNTRKFQWPFTLAGESYPTYLTDPAYPTDPTCLTSIAVTQKRMSGRYLSHFQVRSQSGTQVLIARLL